MLEKNLSELFVTREAVFPSSSQRRAARGKAVGKKKQSVRKPFSSQRKAFIWKAFMGSMCSSDSAAADTLASAPLLTGSDAERQASSSSAKVSAKTEAPGGYTDGVKAILVVDPSEVQGDKRRVDLPTCILTPDNAAGSSAKEMAERRREKRRKEVAVAREEAEALRRMKEQNEAKIVEQKREVQRIEKERPESAAVRQNDSTANSPKGSPKGAHGDNGAPEKGGKGGKGGRGAKRNRKKKSKGGGGGGGGGN